MKIQELIDKLNECHRGAEIYAYFTWDDKFFDIKDITEDEDGDIIINLR